MPVIRQPVYLGALLTLALLATTSPATAQSPFEQNERLGRGVNIIGYDSIWRSWDDARFTQEHFRLIRDGGFSTVRINLHPFRHMDAADGFRLAAHWLEVLDWAVENALDQDLMVILDLHEFNAMADDPESKKDMFLAFWEQIAPRFRNAPSSVLFEVLNEPSRGVTPQMWNRYLRDALAVIRESNPHRTVIVGPAHWNGIGALKELDLPEDDRNIIVTVHYYSPMEFTHQGAPWSEENRDRVGVRWTGSPGEMQQVREDFDVADRWAQTHDRPIFLGEFGAYDKGDMDSRARYTAAVARTAEELGWSWAYWQFDSDFVVYDIDEEQWVEPIRDALVPPLRTTAEILEGAREDEWRSLDPANSIYMEFGGRQVVVELAPELAPRHVANVMALVRDGYFDGGAIVRAQDNYVVQWSIKSDEELSDGIAASLPAEFEVPAAGLPFTAVPDGDVFAPEAGFVRGFPVGRDQDAGLAWMAHCYGAVGVARGVDPNSGSGASLYVVIGQSPRHLDRNLSMVGRVVMGMEYLSTLPRGTGSLGFYESPEERMVFDSVRLGSDIAPADRLPLQVLRTDSDSFRDLIRAGRSRSEDFFAYSADRIGVCNVRVPTRLVGAD